MIQFLAIGLQLYALVLIATYKICFPSKFDRKK